MECSVVLVHFPVPWCNRVLNLNNPTPSAKRRIFTNKSDMCVCLPDLLELPSLVWNNVFMYLGYGGVNQLCALIALLFSVADVKKKKQ